MLLFHNHGAQIMKKGYEQQILSYLAEHEMLSTAEAMRFLPLSEVSVRRIFNRLAESNLVRRVRGGVRLSGNRITGFRSFCADNGSPLKSSIWRNGRQNSSHRKWRLQFMEAPQPRFSDRI